MRIIAGSKRGMKLLPPKGRDTRPITDRVKESLFSILWSKGKLEDCVAADLFCGTGSMGLEALSRGAKYCTFVDSGRGVIEILDRNIAKAGFLAESRSVCANVLKVGAPVTVEHGGYDLVFVDPPYKMSTHCRAGSQVAKLMDLLDSQVNETGVVTLRTHQRSFVENAYGRLVQVDQREWGTMKITFYQKRQESKSSDCAD